jgi:hypothetical protein
VETSILANANYSQKQDDVVAQRLSPRCVDLRVTDAGEAPIRAMTVLKPFFLVASVAFVTGFAGYCALYRLQTPPIEAVAVAPAPLQPAVSDPAPPDALAPGRRI